MGDAVKADGRAMRRASGRAMKTVAGIVIAIASATAILLACGPFPTTLVPVTSFEPIDGVGYGHGDLGVVRPRFARRYLVQAYRVLTGGKPLSTDRTEPAATQSQFDASEWLDLRDDVLGGPPPGGERRSAPISRALGNYEGFDNCTVDAFGNATRTLKARAERFGRPSRELTDWTRAQVAVFQNCAEGPLTVPEQAPAGADPIVRADRAYQTAAAYFYAMQYDEAAGRFRVIAADRSSPWRAHGRYLAARAMIRRATVPENDKPVIDRYLAEAEADLQAVLRDTEAASIHGPARRLADFVAGRLHPVERLHAVSKVLTAAPDPPEQDLTDYCAMMDRLVGDRVGYPAASIAEREAMIRGDDLTDWVVALQGTGPESVARAIERWDTTRAPHWLVAVLWTIPGDHEALPSILDAAQRLEPASPAYATTAFLRVRLLARSGRTDEARALLGTLPSKEADGFSPETVNLLNAERLMLARNFDEFLASAPRQIVVSWSDFLGRQQLDHTGAQTFDEDAATSFSRRLPLARLVEASVKRTLPQRLRRRVAVAAFTRALLLRREGAALQVAPVLAGLAPPLRADVNRYLHAATPVDRQRAGLLLFLRTPGMVMTVAGPDDDYSYAVVEPVRKFDHLLRRTWWCGTETEKPRYSAGPSESVALLYSTDDLPYPAFLPQAEREATTSELQALKAIGPARSYLAGEVIKWAREKPEDADVAEALALVVDGWRWNCGDDDKWTLAREAFRILHGQYPESEWAKKTRYWYR